MKKLLICVLISTSVRAAPITLGPVYNIVEEDALTWVEAKAKSWQTKEQEEKLKREHIKISERYLAHPKGITLPETKTERSWNIDLTVTVEEDLHLADGALLYPKGHTVNPLAGFKSTKTLLFIDGDKLNHWGLAQEITKSNAQNTKIVLTQGTFAANVKRYPTLNIYFDQHGILTRYFGIRAVPAMVSQQGEYLVGKEMLPGVFSKGVNNG